MGIEIYTNIEFNLAELTFRERILEKLLLEGWSVVDRTEHYNNDDLVSINYRFKRII